MAGVLNSEPQRSLPFAPLGKGGILELQYGGGLKEILRCYFMQFLFLLLSSVHRTTGQ